MRVVVLVAIVAAVWIALVFSAQRTVLFPRPVAPAAPPDPVRHRYELWEIGVTSPVEAFFLPATTSTGPAPVMIATHGNGELIDWWLEPYETVRQWGVSVVLVEYPGYGRSRGRPGQDTITEVMTAVFDRATARSDVDPSRVVLHGRSLGGGAACLLATGCALGRTTCVCPGDTTLATDVVSPRPIIALRSATCPRMRFRMKSGFRIPKPCRPCESCEP